MNQELTSTNGRADGAVNAPSADAIVERLGELLERLESVGDPAARATAEDLVSTLMEIYGEGLERIFDALTEETPAVAVRDALLDDGVVASLLLIHGLYPVDLETRVREAVDALRPQVLAEGGKIELVSLDDGVARFLLEEAPGSSSGCAAESATLEMDLIGALEQAAPDLLGVELLSAAEARKARAPRTPLPIQSRE